MMFLDRVPVFAKRPLMNNPSAHSGLSRHGPRPAEITVHTASRALGITFDDGRNFRLPLELLRVYSPSAEVRGHGPGQEVLQTGKREVTLTSVDPVGHYALKLSFSDGHDTGLYTWEYLYEMGLNQDALWQAYLDRLAAAGIDRDAPMPSQGGSGCGGAATPSAAADDVMAVQRCGAHRHA
jgi:DUF971 family protein